MKQSIYKTYDDLPLFLNAAIVSQVLGISIAGSYELMHEKDFPILRINNRMVVPKEDFITWVKHHREAYKNYFSPPNAIFSLNLSPREIAVYSYLLHCEDRTTY